MHCIADYVKMARVALNCDLNVTENEEKLNKIGFLIEQLELFLTKHSPLPTPLWCFNCRFKLFSGYHGLFESEILLINEVYSAKRVEYKPGRFYGKENDEVTKTLLCIMIKSLGGKYNDMIALHSIVSINSQKTKDQRSYLRYVSGWTQNKYEVLPSAWRWGIEIFNRKPLS